MSAGRPLPFPDRPPLRTLGRTRAVRLLMRAAPYPRLRELRDRGVLRPLDPLLRRGELHVLGGIVPRLRLAAAHFEPWGRQAYAVLTGTHEPMVQEALRRTLPAGGVFLDVGANIGATALVAAWLVGPRGRVVAIDAQRECVDARRANAALNGFDHMTALHAAAAAESGTAEIVVVADSLWTRLASVGDHELQRRRDHVRAVALDDLIASGEAPPPDVVKIDVEGGELEVLAGMRELLRTVRPVVICEMHGKNAEFCRVLRASGYRVVNLDGPEAVEIADENVHALCEHTQRGPMSTAAGAPAA